MMKYLFIIFVVLQIVDAFTTYLCLQRPDRAEGNPAVKWIMDKLGVLPTLIMSKLTIIFVIAYVTFLLDVGWWIYAMFVLCAVYALIAVNNVVKLKG